MRKLLLAAAAAAVLCAPLRADPIYQSQVLGCSASAQAAGTIGTTQLVAGVTGKRIYLCGFTLLSTTASGTAQLVYGTGASCTSPTAITPVFTFGAIGQNLSDGSPFLRGLAAAAGASVCVVTATGAVAAVVYYSQF